MSVDGARGRLLDQLQEAAGIDWDAGAVLEAIEALIDAKRAEELDAATLFADRRSSHLGGTVRTGYQLQPHGNEDAQTPGIDEGADSEAVTADHDTIANWVVDGIEADLDDRAGLGLGGMDIEIRSDIRQSWLKIVRGALRKVVPVHAYKFSEPGPAISFHTAWGEHKDMASYDKEAWKRAQRSREAERHTLAEWLQLIVLPSDGPMRITGIKNYPLVVTPMDRRAAELGNPEAREFVAFADDSESS